MLGNIRPKRRCKLKCIYLIACATNPILRKYGFHKIVQPFINDANRLSEVCFLTILLYIHFEFYVSRELQCTLEMKRSW